jgi:DNA processing protein
MSVVMSRADDAALVACLLAAPGLGSSKVLDLLGRYESPSAAVEAIKAGVETVTEAQRVFVASTPVDTFMRSIEATERLGGRIVLWDDDDYPINLRSWEARPPLLYVKGDLSQLKPRSLALVGRVDPTAEGLAAAQRFAERCVDHDIVVVSGLARGIDAASHRGALEAGGWTYAVIGHGLDFAYPRENLELYQRIPERGALISQFPTGTGPQRWTFPMRNEVMCTVALATVIVEGKLGCGSLVQADFSFKHHRPVYLLGRNLDSGADWATGVVKRGAKVIPQFKQVLAELDQLPGWPPRSMRATQVRLPGLSNGDVPSDASAARSSTTSSRARGLPVSKTGAPSGAAAILFDLDGVLADSRPATIKALAAIATRASGRTVTEADVTPYARLSPSKALAALGVDDSWDVYRSEWDQSFADALGAEGAMIDVAVGGVQALRAAGIHVALVTSQPRRRLTTLLPPSVLQLFDAVVAWGDVKNPKPDPEGILTALEMLGVSAERAAYVGDQPADLVAARRAGVRSVAATYGFCTSEELRRHSPDVVIDHPSEIDADLLVAAGIAYER